jgi:hypothetical protein
MPVSYDQGQILKCNVSFSFIRYVMKRSGASVAPMVKNPEAPGVSELNQKRSSGALPSKEDLESVLNAPVINDVEGRTFPLGPGVPNLFPTIA